MPNRDEIAGGVRSRGGGRLGGERRKRTAHKHAMRAWVCVVKMGLIYLQYKQRINRTF